MNQFLNQKYVYLKKTNMYFIGFNVPTNGSMEDHVEDYILEKKLDNDRDLWEDECWGFYDELDLKLFNEEIFSDVEEDGIQTNIKSNNPHISKFIELSMSLQYGFIFFDENFNVISNDKFVDLTNNNQNFTISICQCSPD